MITSEIFFKKVYFIYYPEIFWLFEIFFFLKKSHTLVSFWVLRYFFVQCLFVVIFVHFLRFKVFLLLIFFCCYFVPLSYILHTFHKRAWAWSRTRMRPGSLATCWRHRTPFAVATRSPFCCTWVHSKYLFLFCFLFSQFQFAEKVKGTKWRKKNNNQDYEKEFQNQKWVRKVS